MADITARQTSSTGRYGWPRWVITQTFAWATDPTTPRQRTYIVEGFDTALDVIRALINDTPIDADWLDYLSERTLR